MQSQLFDQRLTQVGVVIHDQQLPRLAHLNDFTRWRARRLPQDCGEHAAGAGRRHSRLEPQLLGASSFELVFRARKRD
jgi:hypothetical protein